MTNKPNLKAVPSPGLKGWKEPATLDEFIRAIEWYFGKQIEPQRKRLYLARLRNWGMDSAGDISQLLVTVTEQRKYLPNIAELAGCIASIRGDHWRLFTHGQEREDQEGR